ncbi:MAG: sodium:solute symporter [Sphingobacteriales bacterium]|nr:sodium:solute symporter [Sphingobacteriales bacterium]
MQPWLILTVVLGYIVLLFVIAHITGKDASNDNFFIAKHQSPWWVVAYGVIGASISGVTFISVPGAVGKLGSVNGSFSYMQVVLGNMVGYAVIALVLLPLYYKMQLTSIYGYLHKRFGWYSYKTGAGFFLLSRTIGAAFRLYLVAVVLQVFLFDKWGVPFYANVIITLILIGAYTLRGGLKTIIWTDTLQTTVMLLTVFVTICYIGYDLGLGTSGLWQAVADSPYSQCFFWDWRPDNYFFKQFLSGAFIAIAMTGLDQDLMQKNNSCRSLPEAQKNMLTSSTILLFVNMCFVGLGALLYVYAQAKGLVLPKNSDYLFPQLAFENFAPWVGILFLVGLTAAAYSSVDSALTALTTSFCVDFLDFEQKTASGEYPEKKLTQTRLKVHISFTLVVLVVILFFNYALKQEVITAVFRVASFTYGPLLGLFAFGLYTKRQIADKYTPVICILPPVICYFLFTYSAQLFWGYKMGFELLLINAALTFLALLLISKK